jgi:hypothetical protein
VGKRSDFERVERDYYPTPRAVAQPLLAHLNPRTRFVEPCAGDGRLMRHLQEIGHICVDAFDIEPQHESVSQGNALYDYFEDATMTAITNPPWRRDFLHPFITHWRAQMPTWILCDADWAHTVQAKPFLPYCHKIVAVGRVKWIEGSKHTGKDNCAWYLFGAVEAPTIFYERT